MGEGKVSKGKKKWMGGEEKIIPNQKLRLRLKKGKKIKPTC